MLTEKLTPEEKEADRRTRQESAMSEMDEMDVIWSGDVLAAAAETEVVEMDGPERSDGRESAGEQEAEPEVMLPVAESPTESAKPTEVEKDEYDFADLLNRMARDAMQEPEAAAPVVPAPVVEVPPIVQAVPTPSAPMATVAEMEEAFNSPEKFVQLLETVYQRAVQDAIERTTSQVPEVSRQVAIQVATQAEMARRFYSTNPELTSYRDFVAYCAGQVEKAHPDWGYQAVMDETAKVARSRLPALRRAKKEGQNRPALPGSGKTVSRSRTPAQILTELEQEINEMPNRF